VSTELRVGVVGLGDWGIEHTRAWLSLPGVLVAAVCDCDPEVLRLVASRYDIDARYTSAAEMADQADLDIVSIANDERLRLDAALPFLAAGVHMVVEKPLALSFDDARRLVDHAAKAGAYLLPSHTLRFDSRYMVLKDRVESGDLGTIRSVYSRRLIPRSRYWKYSRGHPALMAAIHDIDLARWYLQAEPDTVCSYASAPEDGVVPDILWCVLTFPGDRYAVIENAWLLPDRAGTWLESETELIGSAGVARVHTPGQALSLWLPGGMEQAETTLSGYAQGQAWGALRDELAYMAWCVSHSRPPTRVTAEDGLRSLSVALAAAKSAETRTSQRTPGPPGRP
jgi:UDP-N-acetylglucosamine 3-dehydrogenase